VLLHWSFSLALSLSLSSSPQFPPVYTTQSARHYGFPHVPPLPVMVPFDFCNDSEPAGDFLSAGKRASMKVVLHLLLFLPLFGPNFHLFPVPFPLDVCRKQYLLAILSSSSLLPANQSPEFLCHRRRLDLEAGIHRWYLSAASDKQRPVSIPLFFTMPSSFLLPHAFPLLDRRVRPS